MDKDIKKLIERFMAGLTTVEEEDRIAEYFRTHDVSGQWRKYKEMFSWFDKGMPTEDSVTGMTMECNNNNDGKINTIRKNRTRIVVAMLTAAATFALILIMTATKGTYEKDKLAINAPAPSTIQDEKTDKTKKTCTDTVVTEKDTIIHKPQRKHRRAEYRVMPPRTYMAKAVKNAETDSTNIQTEIVITKAEAEQEMIINNVYNEYKRIEDNIELYMTALENYEFEEEDYY